MTAFFVRANSRLSAWRSSKSAWPGSSATEAMLESREERGGGREDSPSSLLSPLSELYMPTPPRAFGSWIIGAVVPAAGLASLERTFDDKTRGLDQVLLLGRAHRKTGFDVAES